VVRQYEYICALFDPIPIKKNHRKRHLVNAGADILSGSRRAPTLAIWFDSNYYYLKGKIGLCLFLFFFTFFCKIQLDVTFEITIAICVYSVNVLFNCEEHEYIIYYIV